MQEVLSRAQRCHLGSEWMPLSGAASSPCFCGRLAHDWMPGPQLHRKESFSSSKGQGQGGPFRLEATESRLGRFSLPSCLLKSCSNIHLRSSPLKILLLPECCHSTRKKKGEKHSVERYLCPSVHCSTIHNSQDVEINQVSTDRGMDKEGVIHIPWNTTQP